MATADVDLPVACADRAVYLPDANALVIADVHLGRGEASAVDAPIDAAAGTVARFEALLDRFDPDTAVVAGDLLHSFAWIPSAVEARLEAIAAAAEAADADLVVVEGNHDALLEEAFDGATTDELALSDGETLVLHGHDPPRRSADRYVIGHDHPALSIDGRKHPCYLYGPGVYDGADLLVLPAFTTLARGTTINRRRTADFASPLVTDAGALHPAIRDEAADETLWFPPLADCRRLL